MTTSPRCILPNSLTMSFAVTSSPPSPSFPLHACFRITNYYIPAPHTLFFPFFLFTRHRAAYSYAPQAFQGFHPQIPSSFLTARSGRPRRFFHEYLFWYLFHAPAWLPILKEQEEQDTAIYAQWAPLVHLCNIPASRAAIVRYFNRCRNTFWFSPSSSSPNLASISPALYRFWTEDSTGGSISSVLNSLASPFRFPTTTTQLTAIGQTILSQINTPAASPAQPAPQPEQGVVSHE